MALAAGARLGPYEIQSLLGAGGMGEVYAARDSRLNRTVAIKILPESALADRECRARLKREARAASALNDSHICALYDIGREGDFDFLVMEFVEGQTLQQRLAQGRLAEEAIVPLALQLVEALEHAHDAGIVHRDLKPANIKITPKGHAKILDFGLAKVMPLGDAVTASAIQTGGMSGTVPYMAPEQLRGGPVDARTDIHALGATLYEMTTGQRPFSGAQAVLTDAILHSVPIAPSRFAPRLSAALERVIMKCLEKDPADRYQSAGEIAVDLRRLSRADFTSVARAPRVRSRWVLIAAAVSAVMITSAVVAWRAAHRPAADRSLAVLPFVDISPEGDQEYFTDGLTEEMLGRLGRVPGVRVAGRTSSFRFKGKTEDLRTIARQLRVATILEGSVRKQGTRVRITAQLVNGEDGFRLWSDTYDRELGDIFAVQDDIARSVAGALRVALTQPRDSSQSRTLEAYNAFLLGAHYHAHPNRENLQKAVESFQQALQLEPRYAEAWAGLAGTLVFQAGSGLIEAEEGYRRGRSAAERALELNPDLPYAHTVMGWIRMSHDWDWHGATASFERACALDPTERSRNAAILAAALGNFEKALSLANRDIEREPLDPESYYIHALLSYYAGHLEEAAAGFRNLIAIAPDRDNVHAMLGQVYVAQSRPTQALIEIQSERDLYWRLPTLAIVSYALGRDKESRAALKEFTDKYEKVGAYQIAEVLAWRGERDAAIDWLERAYTARDGGLFLMKVDPLLQGMRADSRYAVLLQKMKL